MGNRSSSGLPKDVGVRVRRRRLDSFRPSKNPLPACSHSSILLLGCGDAGKTTLCTRWRLWVEQSRQKKLEPELRERHLVAETLKSYLSEVLREIILDEVDFGDSAVNSIVQRFNDLKSQIKLVPLSVEASAMLLALWKNPTFQREFRLKFKHTEVENTLDYFFSDFERFSDKKVQLRPEDILHSRVRTTGMLTREFYTVDNRNIQIVDVAGQRAERHKWTVRFTSSDLVTYLCAISEFDLVLYEDGKTNRLLESLQNFEEIANEPDLYDTKVLLILTKVDLFEKKVDALKAEGKSVKEAFKGEFGEAMTDDMDTSELIEVIETTFKAKAFDNFTSCLKVNLLDAGDQQLFTDVSSILKSIAEN